MLFITSKKVERNNWLMVNNLIKVLLVDDEFLVCSFLKNIISWEEHGFTIVGQASNGKEALKRISENAPDLIFLDVSMPDMDGIELITRLHESYPEIKVIMLSSYSDYEYVRVAMKMNAVDYLLKHHINAEDLTKLLSTLTFNKREENLIEKPPKIIFEQSDVLRDSRVRSFFKNRQHTIPASLIDLKSPIVVVAKIQLSIIEKDAQSVEAFAYKGQFIDSVFSTCSQICAQEYNAKVVYLEESTLIFLFSASVGEALDKQQNRIMRTMSVIHDALIKYHNTYVSFERGNRCESLEMLPAECEKVLALFYKKPESRMAVTQPYQLSIEQERQVLLGVLTKNRTLIHNAMTEIFSPLKENNSKNMEISLIAGDLLTLSAKLYNENKIPFGNASKHEVLSADINDIYLYFNDVFITLIDNIDIKSRYTKTVATIISYIEQHYSQDICLQDIGEHCGKNTTYISTIFKKETGVSLVKYINRLRVFYAGKYMLMDGISPTKVYELVGFNNYNNFFNLFKTLTGMSPTEFNKIATIEWIAKFNPLEK